MSIKRLKELLAKDSINQKDYDEFVAIGNTFTKESMLVLPFLSK